MRNQFADTFYEHGKENEKLAIVVADISPAGSIAKFRDEFPTRFINTGVAEQIMIGLVAGMALRGMRPFAYTIAPFSIFRPFEFVRLDLAYQQLPVTVVGMGAGVTYANQGATHHAQEDIAVASAIPGMQVLAPCDPDETRLMTTHLVKNNQGPAYMRIGKAGEPDLTAGAAEPFEFGRLRYLKRGVDTCVVAYGPIMKMAQELAASLEADHGESVSVISCHTIKPLDEFGIEQALLKHKRIIVVEEAVPNGSLGLRVKQIAWDKKADCDVHAYSLMDSFINSYGSHEDLLSRHGLTVSRILSDLS